MAGGKVEVHSRGQWYPAVITGLESPGRWQIHYDDSPEIGTNWGLAHDCGPRPEH